MEAADSGAVDSEEEVFEAVDSEGAVDLVVVFAHTAVVRVEDHSVERVPDV